MLAIRNEHGSWIAPNDRAVWIPAHTWHEHRFYGPSRFHTVGFPAQDTKPPAQHPDTGGHRRRRARTRTDRRAHEPRTHPHRDTSHRSRPARPAPPHGRTADHAARTPGAAARGRLPPGGGRPQPSVHPG
ncbi:hypothetical protein ACF09J_24860 [Streptomyces sp. NPDC014889]|uniref:hypothetical protein n=1 Tax=Streptomyces sp. NPDC014889 TaxID=3364928 RepID=UPI0036F9C362